MGGLFTMPGLMGVPMGGRAPMPGDMGARAAMGLGTPEEPA